MLEKKACNAGFFYWFNASSLILPQADAQ